MSRVIYLVFINVLLISCLCCSDRRVMMYTEVTPEEAIALQRIEDCIREFLIENANNMTISGIFSIKAKNKR